MKILHVEAGRHLYGGPRQVLLLMEQLAAAGVDNVLACPRDSAIAGAAGAFAAVRPLAMGGDLDLALVPRLARLLRTERPDLAHLHSRRGADVLGALAARRCAVPAVLSRRVDNPEPRCLAPRKYRLYHSVVAISEAIREMLLAAGVPPDRVVCVRDALPPLPAFGRDRPWLEAQLGVPARAPVMAVVAQLIERKGHRFLLEALPRIRRHLPAARLLVLGRGPQEAALRRQAERLGVAQMVRFAGFRDDMPRILPCLDLVVHPALMEGLGVALLEAAAAGVPVVASRAGGIPEAVRHGETGLLVPPGDAAALAAACCELLGDRGRAARLGAGGRALVAREFSPVGMAQGNLAVYRDVLTSGILTGRRRGRAEV